MNLPIIIIGTGGYGQAVADALLAMGCNVEGYTDADASRHGTRFLGLPVIGSDDAITARAPDAVLLANGIGSVGDLSLRRKIYSRFVELGYRFATVVHPGAVVAKSARLESGAQIMAGAVIQPNARIGENTIINIGVVVDHDCIIGKHCHLSPGCSLSGAIEIGDESHVGTGATIRQGIKLGARTVVGVGAAVVRDAGGDCTLVGVPAKVRP